MFTFTLILHLKHRIGDSFIINHVEHVEHVGRFAQGRAHHPVTAVVGGTVKILTLFPSVVGSTVKILTLVPSVVGGTVKNLTLVPSVVEGSVKK